MQVAKFINNPVNSNCYVLIVDGISDCVVIDPGSAECAELLFFLKTNKLNPLYILLTHHHFDHIWGLECLKDHYKDSKIICSEICASLMIDKKRNLSLYYDTIGFEVPHADILISQDTIIDFQGVPITLYIAKGHTSSSILIKIGNNLFTGDNLILNEKTVLKLPTSSREDFFKTQQLINSLKGQCLIVQGGHGDCFDLDTYDINKALE